MTTPEPIAYEPDAWRALLTDLEELNRLLGIAFRHVLDASIELVTLGVIAKLTDTNGTSAEVALRATHDARDELMQMQAALMRMLETAHSRARHLSTDLKP